jgi:hypothetical protein
MKQNILGALAVFSLLVGARAFSASPLQSSEAETLSDSIKHFDWQAPVPELISSYQQIRSGYVNLDRPNMADSDLIELKFQMLFFEQWFAPYLEKRIVDEKLYSRDERQEIFDQLSIILSEKNADKLGIKIHKRAPNRDLDVKPLEGTKWSEFKKWEGDKEFSNYDIDGESVSFHGMTLQTGDVLVGDLDSLTHAISGSFRTPSEVASHSAIFVMMKDGARSIPTVFDVHESGLRATPLSLFLGEKVSAYMEVYRSVTPGPAGWQAALRNAFVDALARGEAFPFDFETNDTDRQAYICTELVEEFRMRAGMPPVRRLSHTFDWAQRNLSLLGEMSPTYLVPNDFATNGQFKMVGYIHSAKAGQEALAWLAADLVGERFRTSTLNVERLQKKLKSNMKIIEKMRKGSFFGKLFLHIAHIPQDSFPSGSPLLIAASVYFDKKVDSGAERCSNHIFNSCYKYFRAEFKDQDPRSFSISDFIANPENRARLGEELSFMDEYFYE